jgi:hypothetical protein
MKYNCVRLASLRRVSGHAWRDQYSNPKFIAGANTIIATIEVKDASGKSREAGRELVDRLGAFRREQH